jgi:TonB family protein
MRAKSFLILLLMSVCVLPANLRAEDAAANRKVVQKTAPVYPEIARRMSLTGTVKLIAVVAPDGKVKSVEAMGGSPILIQAAKDAISQWKYAPGPESREVIEIHFSAPGHE